MALSGCMSSGLPGTDLRPNQYAASGRSATAGIEGGGLIDGAIGQSLSRQQRLMAAEAEYRALENTPAGQDVAWGSAASGPSGTVRAAQPYRVGSQDCRQYTHTVVVGGASYQARGTACRNMNGSWTLLS